MMLKKIITIYICAISVLLCTSLVKAAELKVELDNETKQEYINVLSKKSGEIEDRKAYYTLVYVKNNQPLLAIATQYGNGYTLEVYIPENPQIDIGSRTPGTFLESSGSSKFKDFYLSDDLIFTYKCVGLDDDGSFESYTNEDCTDLSGDIRSLSYWKMNSKGTNIYEKFDGTSINGMYIDKKEFDEGIEKITTYELPKSELNKYDLLNGFVISDVSQDLIDKKVITDSNAEKTTGDDYIKVVFNGKRIGFNQQPVIENGVTLVPMRTIFEELGMKVVWEADTKTITAFDIHGQTDIILVVNSNIADVNGKETELDVAPKIINGTTMVPLRFISESLGAEVNWDRESRTVTINK